MKFSFGEVLTRAEQITWRYKNLWLAGIIVTLNLWMLAFSPVYAVFQGILLTYMQSVWTFTYLRLTRSVEMKPLPGTVEAAA
jgi:hypothetical protein